MLSRRPIDLSPDLLSLRNTGYDIAVVAGYLLVKDVPYVNAAREIKRGILISALSLQADKALAPQDHQCYFVGEQPCNKDGTPITQIGSGTGSYRLVEGLVAQFHFSNKAQHADGSYKPDQDYFEKMTRYVDILSHPAQALDPSVTALTFPVIQDEEANSVFNYMDTASSKAGIAALSAKLELGKVAIIGLGGTGSYVCDLVAKTPVRELHLFDQDRFLQHNAFRSPGAPSIADLQRINSKAAYFAEIYSKMRRGIIVHECYVTEANVDDLRGMDFVFICIDRCEPKKLLVQKLEEFQVPFIDVGMGIQLVDERLLGLLRITTSTDSKHDHTRNRICFVDENADQDYDQNIQIADLNALNASLAVLKWKKIFGFYLDLDQEHNSTYTIDGNILTNEDRP